MNKVSTSDKKEFLKYFIKRYKLKRRECVWILNYLTSHEHLLESVHFTDEAHYCPKAMVMSTTSSESIPFRFYKGNLMSADADKAFNDLRLYDDEKVYIQLNFPNSEASPEYASVREENPFLPSYLQVNEKDKELANQMVNYLTDKMIENAFQKRVDEALDSGDKEMFMKVMIEMGEKVR